MFITIYGINNIGKTTQAKRIVERLNGLGKEAEYIKYPIYDLEPTGPFLNRVLRSGEKQPISEEELQLWFVLNRYQFEPSLKKKLSAGTIIIAEDYIGTGIAWGLAKGANQEWLESINQYLLIEDLSILLKGNPQKIAQEAGHLHETADEVMEKCRELYEKLAFEYDWQVVEVEEEWDQTTEKIWKIVNKVLAY